MTGLILWQTVIAALALLGGFVVFAGAKSAVHEIEAGILFLIVAVLWSAAATIDAIGRVLSQLKQMAGVLDVPVPLTSTPADAESERAAPEPADRSSDLINKSVTTPPST